MSASTSPQAVVVSSPGLSIKSSWESGAMAHAALLLCALVFFALHFVHLSADFPNFSRWMDWSKYTDEGWYGDAAIRHYLLGHWYVPGDFNPAAALPVWPFLEALLFKFSGVSLVAARALTVCVFGGILIASWVLVARSAPEKKSGSIAPSVVVLLLATNPFFFVFTRLAILEPLLILLALVALLAAQRVRSRSGQPALLAIRSNLGPMLLLGFLLPLIILTKTTGLFLVPAIAWMLFAASEYRLRPFLAVGIPAAGLGGLLWGVYFLLVVHPHYLVDYRYLFSANAYTHITRENYASVLTNTLKDGTWFGTPLFAASLAAIVLSLFSFRSLRRYPLIPTLLLWAGGYAAFLAYHDNLQPRYYLVVALPLTLLVPVVVRDLVLSRIRNPVGRSGTILCAALVAAGIVLPDGRETLSIVRHPQYTFVTMAHEVAGFIARDHLRHPNHSSLLLSISGSDLSLITGLHSICDDFGTAELADRVNRYQPGWYAAWGLIEDDKMDALHETFHVQRVATFPAMDDPDRNLMVLYRLDRNGETEDAPGSRRRRSRLGQRPSSSQLQH